MRQSNKYHVAVLVYDFARCAFVLGYCSRPRLMRRKRCARIVARAFVNAKVFSIITLEIVHYSILSLGLRPKYNTFMCERKRKPNYFGIKLFLFFSSFFDLTLDKRFALVYNFLPNYGLLVEKKRALNAPLFISPSRRDTFA